MRSRHSLLNLLAFVLLGMVVRACHAPTSTESPDGDSSLSSTELVFSNAESFQNPIVGGGADPWVIFKDGSYYYSKTDGNAGIYVAKAESLLDIGKVPHKRVWQAPPGTDHSAGSWAAELHFLDGKWYIYYAASAGDNASHRMFVLESVTDDPMGEYTFKGKISAATDRWAIDGTVLENNDGKRYFVWSGWDGFNDYQQNLYIAPMLNPWTIAAANQSGIRLEAEAATLNHVNARNAKLASNARVVGGIDFADSFVEFSVTVPQAGTYQLDLRYSNGTAAESTHTININGKSMGTAVYAPVGWENFQTTQAFVDLSVGLNTIRLGKGIGFAELDCLEVKPKGSDRVVLSMPEFDYEKRGGPAYVNEGPEVLRKNGRIHLIYSASGSWTDDYNLVQLSFQGGDILDRRNWAKRGSVFARTNDVFGPGHASFTQSPDGLEDWIIYHAAKRKGSGWDRDVRAQAFTWDADHNPVFGRPFSPTTRLAAPSGTP